MTDSTTRCRSMHHSTSAPVSIDMHVEDNGISHHRLSPEKVIQTIEAGRAASPPRAGENESGGLLASGFAWVQRKREQRRRQQLQQEAELQLQKIYEAERKLSGTLDDNSTVQQLAVNPNIQHLESDISENDGSMIGEPPRLSKSGEGAVGKLDMSSFDEEDYGDDYIPEVKLETEVGTPRATILSKEQMNQIAIHVLPQTVSFCRWKRLYDLGRDGDSFDGCLRIIESTARTLMVVRTTKGAVFGGYADSAWNTYSSGSARFYGGATACLFSAIPGTDKLKVFKWAGKNRYIQLCDVTNKMFAFGGGGQEGAFGLAVEEDFQRGSTGPCDTFDNEPLCDQENFEIVDIEFWSFHTMW